MNIVRLRIIITSQTFKNINLKLYYAILKIYLNKNKFKKFIEN